MDRQTLGSLPAAFAVIAGFGSFACTSQVLELHPHDGLGGDAVNCEASLEWLPATPEPTLVTPPAHPAAECGFYQTAYQYFLRATQPSASGDPAFAAFATGDDLFTGAQPLPAGALAPAGAHRGTALRAWLGDVKQPGGRQLAIDQDGHSIYYGTHVNQGFVDFVNTNGLRTAAQIQNADPGLTFPPGVVALRSAWKDIDAGDGVSGDFSAFVTTTAWVSRLHNDPVTGLIVEDKDRPRLIRVALLSLHVAFSLPGHPELIWTTFEHVDSRRMSDVAPIAWGDMNPDPGDPLNRRVTNPVSPSDLILYRGGTPTNQSNIPVSDALLALDETTQSFATTTSIYRVFAASRSESTTIPAEVRSLNDNVQALFQASAATLAGADQRGAYALVGGIWMDKPGNFTVDSSLQNDSNSPFVTGSHVDQAGALVPAVPLVQLVNSLSIEGTDSPYSIVGGQDRLVGTATESFDQAPGSFNNCMTCHNTQATSANGVPLLRDAGGAPLIAPKLINVSHVFSRFVLEECGASGVCPAP